MRHICDSDMGIEGDRDPDDVLRADGVRGVQFHAEKIDQRGATQAYDH